MESNQTRMIDGRVFSVKPAAGTKGILCRSIDGGYFLRVTQTDGDYKDYDLRHSDLSITIDLDEEAAFYEAGETLTLDHAPETLGLPAFKTE